MNRHAGMDFNLRQDGCGLKNQHAILNEDAGRWQTTTDRPQCAPEHVIDGRTRAKIHVGGPTVKTSRGSGGTTLSS